MASLRRGPTPLDDRLWPRSRQSCTLLVDDLPHLGHHLREDLELLRLHRLMRDALHGPGVNRLDLLIKGLEGVQVSGGDFLDKGEQPQKPLLVLAQSAAPARA